MLVIVLLLCSCHVRQWPFWFGMLLPFALLYTTNWIIVVTIMVSLFRRRRNVHQLDKDQFQNAKQNLIIIVSLATVFGLGWGFGLAATSSSVIEVTTVFQFLFSILISIHGLLLFILHGIRNADAREVWRKVFVRIRGNFSSGFKKLYTVTSASGGTAHQSTAGETFTTSSISTLQRRKILGSSVHGKSNAEGTELEMSLVASVIDGSSECKVDLSAGKSVIENVHSEYPVQVNTEQVESDYDEASMSKVDLSVADNSVMINSGEETPVVCDIGQANQVISSSSDIVDHSK